MKRKFTLSAPLVASAVAAMIVGTLFLSYILSSGFHGANDEPPPLSATTTDSDLTDGADRLQSAEQIEITPQNIRQVVEALSRVQNYTQTVANTLYYDGQSSTQTVTQYVRGDLCRTDVLRGGSVSESYLRAGDDFYAWQPGSSSCFHGAAGDFSPDSMAMLPNWQTVVSLPQESILSAGSTVVDGEPTLLVTTEQDGRRAEYELSSISGLLTAARFYETADGDSEAAEPIRKLKVTNVSMDEPDASRFTLPDGTVLLP